MDAENTAAKTYVGMSPVGLLEVRGKDRIDLLHRLSTGDLRPLQTPHGIVSTLFTTQQGKVLDWTFVMSRPDSLWVRTSPGRAGPLCEWVDKYTVMEDVVTRDVSADWVLLTLQGPQTVAFAGLAEKPAAGHTADAAMAGLSGIWNTALSAYGERLEALVPAGEPATAAVAYLLQAGAVAASVADLEMWRLRAGVPSPNYEFKEEVNPLELRLAKHAVAWSKGCYIGQEVISRLDSYDKVARLLMGIVCDTPLPRDTELKLTRDGKPLGRITSLLHDGAGSVGLAIVKREAAQPGLAQVITDAGPIAAQLVDRPFWAE